MALFKIPRGSRGIMRLLLIQLVCCFGWFSSFALAQFDISKGVTGSVNFPALGITCVANLAVLVTTLIRGRLDLEMGARDALEILSSTKLKNIEGIKHGNGLTTCTEGLQTASVVMLSNGTPNWSMRQFMKSNAPIVHSIQLQFLRLQDAVNDANVTIQTCQCSCNCIVFWTAEEIASMLARLMPGTLKQLSSSFCLLPCLTCLTNGCHGCHEEGESKVVSEILNDIGDRFINAEEHICICIPMHGASSDVWTELLVRSLRSKDAEGRGVRVKASEALEGYLAGRREGANEIVEYNISSLIVPRLTEVVINLVLTFWFRVDGFSSALLARRTIRDYLVDTKGSGLAANAFLTKAIVVLIIAGYHAFLTKVKVKSDDSCSQVCQVLFFRGNHVRIITLSTGCVNLICSLGWAVLISFEGGADASPPPSMTILVLIIAAIATALGMDAAIVLFNTYQQPLSIRFLCIIFVVLSPIVFPMLLSFHDRSSFDLASITFLAVSALETVCIVAGSAVAGTLGIKAFGRWVYAVLQILVWLKWAGGSLALTEKISTEFLGRNPESWAMLMYSSAFMLNAVLAGVRCKWEPWPWKDNHLFSRKLRP